MLSSTSLLVMFRPLRSEWPGCAGINFRGKRLEEALQSTGASKRLPDATLPLQEIPNDEATLPLF